MALIDSLNPKRTFSADSTLLTQSQLELLEQSESEIDEVLEDDEESGPLQYAINTTTFPVEVETLVSRLKRGELIIPPFQRGYVWTLKEASRFVESLLFGLPIPSVFVSVEPETERRLVVDGRQRLSTLLYFYDGTWPATKREFAIKGTGEHGRFEGKTYKTLSDADRRKLDYAKLSVGEIKQEQPSGDDSSIYHVFERLNTSGVTLTAQEIRTAVYHGAFCDLLRELNRNKAWRDIYGAENKYMKDQELILRFLAFYYSAEKYKAPMKDFLNGFMACNRKLEKQNAETLKRLFDETIGAVYSAIGKRAFRPERAINTAVFDSVMVGVARAQAVGEVLPTNLLKSRYESLLRQDEFRAVTQHSTGHPKNVEKRMEMAASAFAGSV